MLALGKSARVFCWFPTRVNSQCLDNPLAQIKQIQKRQSVVAAR